MSVSLQFTTATSSSCILSQILLYLNNVSSSPALKQVQSSTGGCFNDMQLFPDYYRVFIHHSGLQIVSLFCHPCAVAHPQKGQSLMLWKWELSFEFVIVGTLGEGWQISVACKCMSKVGVRGVREEERSKLGWIIHWAVRRIHEGWKMSQHSVLFSPAFERSTCEPWHHSWPGHVCPAATPSILQLFNPV